MKRIDLRIFIVIGAFYAPGVLLLIGAWLLGYSTSEARDVVAMLGGMIGLMTATAIAFALFAVEPRPIWWEFRK